MQNKLLYLIVTILFLSLTSTSVLAKPVQVEDAESIHFDSTVVDGHSDIMMNVIDEETWLPKNDIGEETSFHLDIPKAQAGGVDAPFFAAFTSGFYDNNPRTISRTLALINALYWTEEQNPDTSTLHPPPKKSSKQLSIIKLRPSLQSKAPILYRNTMHWACCTNIMILA